MSSVTGCPIQLNVRVLDDARESLASAFGVGFRVWFMVDGAWSLVSASGQLTESVATQALAHELTLAAEAGEPRVVLHPADSTALVAFPLPRQARGVPVAVADAPCRDESLTRKYAELVLREYLQRTELQEVRGENEAFLRQVTNDFEELTFLRSMAELLEISDLSFDFVAMAETVVPTLKPLLDTNELALFTALTGDSDDAPRRVGDRAIVRAGERQVDEELVRKLIEEFRDMAALQPVVKNNFAKTNAGERFPGIESFVLVAISSGGSTLGWLLAVNRNHERNLLAENMPWEVSYLEFGTHEATLMSSSAAILATHSRNVELFREREKLLVNVVRALVSAIEAKDEYTRGHSERVALYGRRLAEELGHGREFCQRLYLTGLMHDVGKIGIRDAVLRKPGPLTDEEFEEIKQHPDMGWAILQDLEQLTYVLPGVLHHHENYDGGGYPDQLAREDIPLDGRILAVADAYDAMTSDRPYRPGMPQEKAEAILRGGSGRQWDPEAIEAFFLAMPDILRIKETYQPRLQPQRKKKSAPVVPASSDTLLTTSAAEPVA